MRNLVRRNERVLGETAGITDDKQMIREHVEAETNQVGRRVMRQRRVKIPVTTRSSY